MEIVVHKDILLYKMSFTKTTQQYEECYTMWMANLLLNVKFYKILKWNVADPTFILFSTRYNANPNTFRNTVQIGLQWFFIKCLFKRLRLFYQNQCLERLILIIQQKGLQMHDLMYVFNQRNVEMWINKRTSMQRMLHNVNISIAKTT